MANMDVDARRDSHVRLITSHDPSKQCQAYAITIHVSVGLFIPIGGSW